MEQDKDLEWILVIFILAAIMAGMVMSSLLYRVWDEGLPVRQPNESIQSTEGDQSGYDVDPGIRQNLPTGM